MSPELILDPKIRAWVFLPIVLLSLFIEILRRYAYQLFTDEKCPIEDIQATQMKLRLIWLVKHHGFIPRNAFEARRKIYNTKKGFLNPADILPVTKSPNPMIIQDPDQLLGMMKGQMSYFPVIMAGTWVSYTFTSFICTKIPFPLTLTFKPMLQSDIDLNYLNPSWVSACSWYFLNVCGIKSIMNIFFHERLNVELDIASVPTDNDSLQMIVYEKMI